MLTALCCGHSQWISCNDENNTIHLCKVSRFDGDMRDAEWCGYDWSWHRQHGRAFECGGREDTDRNSVSSHTVMLCCVLLFVCVFSHQHYQAARSDSGSLHLCSSSSKLYIYGHCNEAPKQKRIKKRKGRHNVLFPFPLCYVVFSVLPQDCLPYIHITQACNTWCLCCNRRLREESPRWSLSHFEVAAFLTQPRQAQ